MDHEWSTHHWLRNNTQSTNCATRTGQDRTSVSMNHCLNTPETQNQHHTCTGNTYFNNTVNPTRWAIQGNVNNYRYWKCSFMFTFMSHKKQDKKIILTSPVPSSYFCLHICSFPYSVILVYLAYSSTANKTVQWIISSIDLHTQTWWQEVNKDFGSTN